MATKMCFLSSVSQAYREEIISFEYIKGMAFSQKQKNVLSFHSSIGKQFPNAKILEVSTKSQNELGVALSAFNLKLNGFFVENVFQASKVFADGTQFKHLLYTSPKEARQIVSNYGDSYLTHFAYDGKVFSLKPRSMFYDYLYINALEQVKHLSHKLTEYDIFTDIEFNEKKQYNCQARSCAIYSYLLRTNQLKWALASVDNFAKLYGENEEQLTFM